MTIQVNVSAQSYAVSVTETPTNITITQDGDQIANLTTTTNTVDVGTVTANVSVAEGALGINFIRSLFGNVDPILYDQANGVYSFREPFVREQLSNIAPILYDQANGIISIDEAALFSGKTTDDLAEGSTNLYYTNARVLSYIIDNGLDFNAEKVDDRVANLIITSEGITKTYDDANGTLLISQNINTDQIIEGSANLWLNGSGTTDDLAEGSANLWYTIPRANSAIDARVAVSVEAADIRLKQFRETVYDTGTQSNSTLTFDLTDGTIQKATLATNINNIDLQNVQDGSGITILLQQDAVGGWLIYPQFFSGDWNWVNNLTGIDDSANAQSMITVFRADGEYYASVMDFDDLDGIDLSNNSTDDLPEGVLNLYYTTERAQDTVANMMLTSGNLSYTYNDSLGTLTLSQNLTTTDIVEGSNKYFTNSRSRAALSSTTTAPSGDGAFTYTPATGVMTFTPADVPTNTDELPQGSTNLYYSDALANSSITNYFADGARSPFSINGDLQIQGNVDYVNVQDLLVTDQSITLNYGNAAARDAFVYVDRSGSALNNAHIKWNETFDKWEIYDGAVTHTIPRSTGDLVEGSRLYFTTDRANAAIADYSGSIDTVGDITANAFVGDGSGILNVSATNVDYDNTNVALSATTVQAAISELELNKLDANALTSSVTFFPTDSAYPLGAVAQGYFVLVTSTSEAEYDTTPVNINTGGITGSAYKIASLSSKIDVLEGNTTPINITTVGQIRKVAGGSSQTAEFYFEVYKGDSANVETLIGTSLTTGEVIDTSYATFRAEALITDTNFTASDRVVLKFYGNNIGGGAPQYEFQFGGGTPVRTLFPVPVSVVPIERDADVIQTDTTNFDGILGPFDDNVQKALDTLDDITTTNIPEGSNQYYTDAKVNTAIENYTGNIDVNAVRINTNLVINPAGDWVGNIAGLQGTQGITGSQGIQGTTGSSGATGAQGIQGTIGAQGITGSQGIQGTAGTIGVDGAQGIQGITGSVGAQGITGAQGIQGNTGSVGSQGIQGSTGATGAQGIQGSTGATGAQGIQGNIGATGAQGIQGTIGAQGTTGSQGITGAQGITGSQGIQGSLGTTGAQGIQGTIGFGAQGIQGTTGSQGIQGRQGIQGTIGPQGITGAQGITGSQGIQGSVGAQGITGSQGNTGSQGIQGRQGTVGAQGIQGNVGSQGIQGGVGSQGITGAQGITGSQGIQGGVGSQGVQGIQGTFGDTGLQGPTGAQGVQGIQGTFGPQGITGAQGITGSQGIQGTFGIQGIQGTAGTIGVDGAQGIQGTTGSQGITGIQGITGAQGIQGIQGITGSNEFAEIFLLMGG